MKESFLPETSPENYLTGKTALNIPSSDGTGDWHFFDSFSRSSRYSVAGKNQISTTSFCGNVGIYECSKILQKRGISCAYPVYAADHFRAVVDLLLDGIMREFSLTGAVILDDWFNTEAEKQRIFDLLESARKKLNNKQQEALLKWIKTQQN